MLFFYEPPKETPDGQPWPPFVFESSGDTKVLVAHNYWKKAQQTYEIEKLWERPGVPVINPATGEQRVVKGKKTVYVLDEEKNIKMKQGEIPPPSNMYDLSNIDLDLLKQSRYQGQIKHLVSQDKKYQEEKKHFEKAKKEEFQKFEQARVELEQERIQLENARKELQKAKENVKKEVAATNEDLAEAKREKRRN